MIKRKTLWADVILIASLLLVAAISLSLLLIFQKDGEYAVVELDGEIIAKYSLAENGEYSLNGGTNILVIKDGEAYLSFADCPDRTCVKSGRINKVGESIICLPNRVSVYIAGDAKDGAELVS